MVAVHRTMVAITEMNAAWVVVINGTRVHKEAMAAEMKEGPVVNMADAREVAVQKETTVPGMIGT